MEAINKRFRTPYDPLKLVIVRDMWLTGFDAPCAHTMYADKIMKDHNLMQVIARVNRVFEDKPNGLVVDFIGIAGFLAAVTKKYTSGGGEGKPTIDMDAAVELYLEQFATVKNLPGNFDLEVINKMTASTPIVRQLDNWGGISGQAICNHPFYFPRLQIAGPNRVKRFSIAFNTPRYSNHGILIAGSNHFIISYTGNQN